MATLPFRVSRMGPMLLMLLAALAALVVSLPASSRPAAPVWSKTVTQSAQGAFIIGNPRAKVRLVEYLSYTCPHCATFATASDAPLKRDYVDKGLVAVEMRSAVRDPLDLTAATLARCSGGPGFLGHHHALMATQSQWLGRAQSLPQDRLARWYEGDPATRMRRIAADTGMNTIARGRGMSQPQIDACFANPAHQRTLAGMIREAWEIRKIDGTPAFLVNGTLATGARDWPAVKSALDRALAAG